MHLKKQVTSWLSHVADGGREFQRRRAWHPTAKQKLIHVHTVIAKAFIAWIGVSRIHGLGLGDNIGVFGVSNQGVVIHRAVARSDFDSRNFSRLREARRNDKDLILVLHVAEVGEWLWHAQNEVGLADLAAFRKTGQSWIVGGITLGHSLLHPGADHSFLVIRQKPLSAK